MQITNVTTLKFTVSSKAVLCELQPLQIDLNYKVSDSKEATYPLETIGLSEASVEQVKNLLMERKYWGHRLWSLYICSMPYKFNR